MASLANIGYGTVLAFSSDDSSYTDIGELGSCTPFAPTRDEVEVTHYGSTNRYKEFIPGLIDAGTIEFEANWIDDSTQDTSAGIASLIDETSLYYFRITFPDTSTWKCQGFVTNFTVTTPINDRMMITGSIKLTGQPTYTSV